MKKHLICVLTAIALLCAVLPAKGAEFLLVGDVNEDGRVTALDARLTLRASASLERFTPRQKRAASVLRFDDRVTAADARAILRTSARLQTLPGFVTAEGEVHIVTLDGNNDDKELAVAQAVARITAPVQALDSDYEKELYLHDWIVENCEYDTELASSDQRLFREMPDSATAYGCLVLGKAVCQGYSAGFIRLLNAVGIRSEYVISDRMDHGWNVVWLDGEPYYVDVTWDDPILQPGQTLTDAAMHRYFNLTSEKISANHYGWVPNVLCTATTYRYQPSGYDVILDTGDTDVLAKVEAAIDAAVADGRSSVQIFSYDEAMLQSLYQNDADTLFDYVFDRNYGTGFRTAYFTGSVTFSWS